MLGIGDIYNIYIIGFLILGSLYLGWVVGKRGSFIVIIIMMNVFGILMN